MAQRIVARYHLTQLTRLEVAAYVVHRLRIAGTQTPIFPYALIGSLHRLTGGAAPDQPGVRRALLGTFVQRELQVTPKILKKRHVSARCVATRRR